MLKNRNYDNDNDKLQCFTKTFNSQKYKKMSPGKYPMLLYVAVSIRWISIRFDAIQSPSQFWNFPGHCTQHESHSPCNIG